MATWFVRAGRNGIYAGSWLDAGVVGINWDFNGADIASMSHDQIREAYLSEHAGEKPGRINNAVGQVFRFSHDFEINDTVVMYDPTTRLYHVGIIKTACQPVSEPLGVTYARKVAWDKTASRDYLSPSSKNSLGSSLTLFSVSDDVLADINKAANGPSENSNAAVADDIIESDEESLSATYEDGIERIKDKILTLSWEDVERLVASLLRATGYHARVTPKGPDGGRDVVASPDALGLESPCIVAEVKHRKEAIGAPAIRSFIGGLRQSDRGLYVSTGGFTHEARIEADRANIPIRLINLDDFARLYAESFDSSEEDMNTILPLVKIWWPA